MKPVELIERALVNSSKAGDLVLDLFGGSGSTLIACEKMGRSSRLIELDPKYCDVIVKRWQDFAGKTAQLEDGRTLEELETMRQTKQVA
jgi:DNA modification methylase